jgi:pyruvate/2-oxoglutarate dehydrogenase complex dihydrolipoamide acyltransferase (E2) component
LLIIIRLKVQTNLQSKKKLNQCQKKKKKKKKLQYQEAATDGQRILASPLAKKIANDKGIQLTQVRFR